ncbi:MAG: Fe-S cluster assembly sulfur transfer protein SufU [Polyangiaceae bacterium]
MTTRTTRALYEELIVDHARRPRNFGKLAEANRRCEGVNPICGDKVMVYARVEDGVVKDVRFEGAGCAISTASASMMTEHVKSKTVGEAEASFSAFRELVMRGEHAGGLGKLAVFQGVSEFPGRVKCASLPWHALHAALALDEGTVSTE